MNGNVGTVGTVVVGGNTVVGGKLIGVNVGNDGPVENDDVVDDVVDVRKLGTVNDGTVDVGRNTENEGTTGVDVEGAIPVKTLLENGFCIEMVDVDEEVLEELDEELLDDDEEEDDEKYPDADDEYDEVGKVVVPREELVANGD